MPGFSLNLIFTCAGFQRVMAAEELKGIMFASMGSLGILS